MGCSPWGREESDMTERIHFHFSLSCIGEGNGNPLQCSCLENPRDGGAWWAAVYGVAQSQTRLKRLSSSSSHMSGTSAGVWMKLLEFDWSSLPNKIQLLTWGPAFQTAKVKAIRSIIRLSQTDTRSLCHILWVKTSCMATYIKERVY